jgi:long-chain acyl-CoA synthetase
MFKEWELEYQLNDLGAKVLVALDHLYPVVEQVQPKTSLELVVATNYSDFLPKNPKPTFPEKLIPKSSIPNTYDLMDILRSDLCEIPREEIDPENDVCLIVYTSGSTGMPKGAMLTYRNSQFKTDCVARTYGYSADDVYLCVMPIFHIAGLLFSANVPIYTGGTIVMLTRFAPEAVLEAIDRYRITSAYTVVPMNVAMMEHPMAKEVDFSSFRLNPCTSFGILLTDEISRAWRELTGALLFEIAYGLSETHTADTLMPIEGIKFGSHGKPTFETKIRIVSLEDPNVEMPVGEQGEIVVKSPGVFKGYLNKPKATQEALRNGWLFTGDIGKFDEEGYLYFLGRKKEMIKCSGYSVFPEEVERMLLRHPAIKAVAVIGVPDPVRGESVKAFIVLKEEYRERVSAKEIIAWSRERMANYKYPRYVEFRNSLPATGTGKLLRRVLEEEERAKQRN